jgi:hypothetical protein
MWSRRWNEKWQGNPKYSERNCPSATLSTTNPTRPDLGSNQGRRGGKPATSRQSYGTAFSLAHLLVLRKEENFETSALFARVSLNIFKEFI